MKRFKHNFLILALGLAHGVAIAEDVFDLKLEEKSVTETVKAIQTAREKLKDKEPDPDAFPLGRFCRMVSGGSYGVTEFTTPYPIRMNRSVNRKVLNPKDAALLAPLLDESAAYMAGQIRRRLRDDEFSKKRANSSLGNTLACLRFLDSELGQSQLPDGYERTFLRKISSGLLTKGTNGEFAKQACAAVCETLASGKPLDEIARLDAKDRGNPVRVVTEALDAWWILEASIACPDVKSGPERLEKALKTWSESYRVFQKNSFAPGHKLYAYANYFNARLLRAIARNETREKPPVKLLAENTLGKDFDKRAAVDAEHKQLARYTGSWEDRTSEKHLENDGGKSSGLENFTLGTFLAVLPETRQKMRSELTDKIDKKDFREKETSNPKKSPSFMPYTSQTGVKGDPETWLSSANRAVPWALIHYLDNRAESRDELFGALERYVDAGPALVDALMQYDISHAETLDKLANYYFGPSIFQAHGLLAFIKRNDEKPTDAERNRVADLSARLQATTLLAYRGKGAWASPPVEEDNGNIYLAAAGYNRAFFTLGLVTACTEGRGFDAEMNELSTKAPSSKSEGKGKSH